MACSGSPTQPCALGDHCPHTACRDLSRSGTAPRFHSLHLLRLDAPHAPLLTALGPLRGPPNCGDISNLSVQIGGSGRESWLASVGAEWEPIAREMCPVSAGQLTDHASSGSAERAARREGGSWSGRLCRGLDLGELAMQTWFSSAFRRWHAGCEEGGSDLSWN